ncbi:hypothetical protein J6590_058449 [Homalodisca vitripennis]|nr:hypothetical protein J6590_058449 [Homalodisca vitripennis]
MDLEGSSAKQILLRKKRKKSDTKKRQTITTPYNVLELSTQLPHASGNKHPKTLDLQRPEASGIPKAGLSKIKKPEFPVCYQHSVPSGVQKSTVIDLQHPGTSGIKNSGSSNTKKPGLPSSQNDRPSGAQQPTSSHTIMPTNIRPLPSFKDENISKSSKTRGRPSSPATVLTSSPYKNKLSFEVEEKEKKKYAKNNLVSKTNKGKRPLSFTEKKEKETIIKKKKRRRFQSLALNQPLMVSTDEQDSEDDCECPYCNQSFLTNRKGEKWITCTKCRVWCHEQCSEHFPYMTYASAEQAHISSHRRQLGLHYQLKHSQGIMHWNGWMIIEEEKEMSEVTKVGPGWPEVEESVWDPIWKVNKIESHARSMPQVSGSNDILSSGNPVVAIHILIKIMSPWGKGESK